jgi:hypothetical protein
MAGTLSPNQQAMLDLALSCDLRVSDPALHVAIQTRHQSIVTQEDAADYIREVENKIHSRRQFRPQFKKQMTAKISPARLTEPLPKTRPMTCVQASFLILLLIILMGVAGWVAPMGYNLGLVVLSMFLMMVVLGIFTANRPLGILINERNLMSLARFQMVIWTLIVLGTYLTFAFTRIKMMAHSSPIGNPLTDPLDIQIDPMLWALMGISTTSLIGSPLILSTKKDQNPARSVTQKTSQMLNEPESEIAANKEGTLYANSKASDACLTDMFEGDELVNTARIDLAKLQMFYFTIIAAICHLVMVFKMLLSASPDLSQLPSLPQGLVAILGISHAGYLTSKGINRTQSQP